MPDYSKERPVEYMTNVQLSKHDLTKYGHTANRLYL